MTDCILWTGYRAGPYGQVMVDGKKWGAHRLAYTKAHGEIPEGMVVRHTCDTPLCVNPEHLILGTTRDNVMDCVKRGRHSRAKLSPEQVREIRKDTRSSRKVAADYGVDHKQILAIRKGIAYSHIQ